MPSYLDSGYNEFISKESPIESTSTQELDPLQFEQFTQQISGSKIVGGLIQSLGGKVKIDLEKNLISINDGSIDRVLLGNLPDGTIGFLIQDKNSNKLMQISGETNIIKSSNGAVEIDFNEERLLIRDAGGTPRVLLGKQIGGF